MFPWFLIGALILIFALGVVYDRRQRGRRTDFRNHPDEPEHNWFTR